jgi:hypothetical protein
MPTGTKIIAAIWVVYLSAATSLPAGFACCNPDASNGYPATLARIEQAVRGQLENDPDDPFSMDQNKLQKTLPPSGIFTLSGKDGENAFSLTIFPYVHENASGLIYGVKKTESAENTISYIVEYGEKISPRIKEKMEKALGGTFELIVSNQSLDDGPEQLRIRIDGEPFVAQRFEKGKVVQHRFYRFPTFLAAGKHVIEIFGSGFSLEKSFEVAPEHDAAIIYFFCRPWYRFWEKDQLDFSLAKRPVYFR